MAEKIWSLQQSNHLLLTYEPYKNLSKHRIISFIYTLTNKSNWEPIQILKDIFQHNVPDRLNAMKIKFNKVT